MQRLIVVIGIIVNLFLPGLGSLMMRKWVSGIIQLALVELVHFVAWITFGIGGFVLSPLFAIAWLWALIGGIGSLMLGD